MSERCTQKTTEFDPRDLGLWSSFQFECPTCGRIVTSSPNGNLAPHDDLRAAGARSQRRVRGEIVRV